jgi:endoglucanase
MRDITWRLFTPLRLAILAGTMVAASATQSAELVQNGSFDAGTQDWWWTQNIAPEIRDGRICADIPGGTTNPWDIIIGQDNLELEEGGHFRFAYRVWGNPRWLVRALVQVPEPPWDPYVEITSIPTAEGESQSATFHSKAPPPGLPPRIKPGQVVFQVGGSATPWTFCVDEVSVTSGAEFVFYRPDTGPRVRVNQFGYLPDGPKRATVVTDAPEPVPWQIEDARGAVVLEGLTTPRGFDAPSGTRVHTVDFTALQQTGEGFVLRADGDRSYPFAVRPGLYRELLVDALSYFYPVRSGIEILDSVAGEGYGRPAGHVGAPDTDSINQGDNDVPCQDEDTSRRVYGEPWTCDYRLNVTGGWYDAGDHGKYVVNGGISVAQLLAAYERAKLRGGESLSRLGDGTLRIPETGNGVPDVLDEARWHLEFMLRMIVPEGDPLAGMVHHKIHDNEWTGLPLMPHLDPKTRELHRPSTAATLNLSAVAAQGARIYREFDPAFADRLIEAAQSTWEAALAHPALYATARDGRSGGGPYHDYDVSDEFYWAAAELFITTGAETYHEFLKNAPEWSGDVFRPEGFDWGHVAALGRLSLATVPSRLPDDELKMVRDSVIAAADRFVETVAQQPFGHPYAPRSVTYDWGSNHLVVQTALVIATAYDLTGDRTYRDAAVESVDYLLGRNALNISYITGYGTVYSKNQHSRWFAASLNPDLPHPPKGSLAGGPNSGIQDPTAQRLFRVQGCPPATCYVDAIQSWATNEVTINWNAALSQFAAFLADQ